MSQIQNPYTVPAVNERLFFTMPHVPTDVGILFGARSVSGLIAREAAHLWRLRRFSKIIVTGGLKVFQPVVGMMAYAVRERTGWQGAPLSDFLTFKREADYMRGILLENGVPEEAIVCTDRRARNTGENLKNINDTLRQYNSATLVTLSIGQRRVIGTLRRHFNDRAGLAVTTVPVYPFGLTRENWPEYPFFKKLVLEEFRKVTPTDARSYIPRFCEEVDITAECKAIQEAPHV